MGVGFYCASFVEEDKSFSVVKFSCRRIDVIFPCLSDLVDNYYYFHPKLAHNDNLIMCFLQGAFGKNALIGFGLTTYTLLGLGVVRLIFAWQLCFHYHQEPCISTST